MMDLSGLSQQGLQLLAVLLPAALWAAFWLWAINWKKVWPVLAAGGWAPVVLLTIMAALVWSRIQPGTCSCLGMITFPNFWSQLGSVTSLVAIALFCGWLQGLMRYEPIEVSVEPPAADAHDHGAAHGHH
jgi:hypothetical protein